MKPRLLALTASLVILAPRLAAQTVTPFPTLKPGQTVRVRTGGGDAAPAQVCFRGRPLETCLSCFVTEFDARFHPTRTSAGGGSPTTSPWE